MQTHRTSADRPPAGRRLRPTAHVLVLTVAVLGSSGTPTAEERSDANGASANGERVSEPLQRTARGLARSGSRAPGDPIVGFAEIHSHMFYGLAFGGGWKHGDALEPQVDCNGGVPESDADRDHGFVSGLTTFVGHCQEVTVGETDQLKLLESLGNIYSNIEDVVDSIPLAGNQYFVMLLQLLDDLASDQVGATIGSDGDTGKHPERRQYGVGWPRWDSLAHEQFHVDDLHDAFMGGMKLVVLTASSFRFQCEMIPEDAFVDPADCNCDEMCEVEQQLIAANDLADDPAYPWFEIALSPTHARQIIDAGRLAVVLSIETSELFGNPTTTESMRAQVKKYYDPPYNVRNIQLIHEVDNAFGGAAVFHPLFHFSRFFDERYPDDGYCRLDETCGVTLPPRPYDEFPLDPCNDPSTTDVEPYEFFGEEITPFTLGFSMELVDEDDDGIHDLGEQCINAQGLTDLGRALIDELVARNMLIDVSHIGEKTFDDVYEHVSTHHAFYPIHISHGHFEDVMATDKANDEKTNTIEQVFKIRRTGGMFGLRTDASETRTYKDLASPPCQGSSWSFAQAYTFGAEQLQVDIAFGADLNSFIQQTRPRFYREDRVVIDTDGTEVVLTNGACGAGFKAEGDCQAAAQLESGGAPPVDSDFDTLGLAHVGLLPDFVADLENLAVDTAGLWQSAEKYLQMWQRGYDATRTEVLITPRDPALIRETVAEYEAFEQREQCTDYPEQCGIFFCAGWATDGQQCRFDEECESGKCTAGPCGDPPGTCVGEERYCGRTLAEWQALLPTENILILDEPQAEPVVGTDETDLILGSSGADVIDGGGGDDCIYGRGGGDTVNGGDGADVIFGDSLNDNLMGDAGDDLLFGVAPNALLTIPDPDGGSPSPIVALLVSAANLRGFGDGLFVEADTDVQGEGDGIVDEVNATVVAPASALAEGANGLQADQLAFQNDVESSLWDPADAVMQSAQAVVDGGTCGAKRASVDWTIERFVEQRELLATRAAEARAEAAARLDDSSEALDRIRTDADVARLAAAADAFAAQTEARFARFERRFDAQVDALEKAAGACDFSCEEALGRDGADLDQRAQTELVTIGEGFSDLAELDLVATGNSLDAFADTNVVASADAIVARVDGGLLADGALEFREAGDDFMLQARSFAAGLLGVLGPETTQLLAREGLPGDEAKASTGAIDDTCGGETHVSMSGGGGKDLLIGSYGADLLEGGDDGDVLLGLNGDDVAFGGTGADVVLGLWGNDDIHGEDGADILFGNAGKDCIDGGYHNDLLFGDLIESLDAFSAVSAAAADVISALGKGDNDVLVGGPDTPQPAGVETDRDILFGNGGADTMSGGYDRDILFGNGDNDVMVGGADELIEPVGDILFGNDGDDCITGSGGKDVIFGNRGDDTLHGGSLTDVMFGNRGTDTMYGDGAADVTDPTACPPGTPSILPDTDVMFGDRDSDVMHGGPGNDVMFGGADRDVMFGGADDGIELLFGGKGDDDLYATGADGADGTASNLLFGNLGNDCLSGGSNTDLLFGNGDDDLLYGSGGWDLLFGNKGMDTLRGDEQASAGDCRVVGEASGDATLDLLFGNEGDDTLYGNDGADLLFGNAGSDDLHGGAGTPFDLLFGNADNDFLYGEADPDVVFGNDGDDTIEGGTGNPFDLLFGNQGDDVVFGNAPGASADGDIMFGNRGCDWLYGGDLFDLAWGNAGDDHLYGFDGPDLMWGNDGDDTLEGGFGTPFDLLFGNRGDDEIRGQGDTDVIFGNRGEDELHGGDGADFLIGGSDDDELFGGVGRDILVGQRGDDTLHGGTGPDALVGGAGNDTMSGESETDLLLGNSGGDVLNGGPHDDLLIGSSGHDELLGEDGSDMIFGNAGNDVISGGEGARNVIFGHRGDDWIDSGAGNDYIFGNRGDDRIDAGDGDDLAVGNAGRDIVIGGNGRNTLLGNSGGDCLFGGADRDLMLGNDGDDYLYGFGDQDWLIGNRGVDKLSGGDAKDYMFGNRDADWMIGGGGDDRMFGNRGADQMLGGAGADRMWGNGGDDTMDGGYGDGARDRLYGNLGEDRLYGDSTDRKNRGFPWFGDSSGRKIDGPGDTFEIAAACSGVRGRSWLDVDRNGVRGPREPRLGGIRVYVDRNRNRRLDGNEEYDTTRFDDPTTARDETGEYRFDRLEPHRSHLILPDRPATLDRTTPDHSAELKESEVLLDVNFGFFEGCAPAEDGLSCFAAACPTPTSTSASASIAFPTSDPHDPSHGVELDQRPVTEPPAAAYSGVTGRSTSCVPMCALLDPFQIVECDCRADSQVYLDASTPAQPVCGGSCPTGEEPTLVTRTVDGETIHCCECVAIPPCRPNADGSACEGSGTCAAGSACEPTCVNFAPFTGDLRILACGCSEVDGCHVDVTSAAPGVEPECVGASCGSGYACDRNVLKDCAGGTIDVCCECAPTACAPLADGSACNTFSGSAARGACEPSLATVAPRCVDSVNPGERCTADTDCTGGVCEYVRNIEACEFVEDEDLAPAACELKFDRLAGPYCEGECAAGIECTLVQVGEALSCVCQTPECAPLPDGSGCAPGPCGDSNTCVPTVISIQRECDGGDHCAAPCTDDTDCPGGACTDVPLVVDCACQGPGDCVVDHDPVAPPGEQATCLGACADGADCELYALGANTFTCDCIEPDCEPTRDATACRPYDCGGDGGCIPTALGLLGRCVGGNDAGQPCTDPGDCDGGLCDTTPSVVECDCTDGCHVEYDETTATPSCVGGCADGDTDSCVLIREEEQVYCVCLAESLPLGCPTDNTTGLDCDVFSCPGSNQFCVAAVPGDQGSCTCESDAGTAGLCATPTVSVVSFTLADDGDGDGFADALENVTLTVRLLNGSGITLTDAVARIAFDDPASGEILQGDFALTAWAADEVRAAVFAFRVAAVDEPFDSTGAAVDVAITAGELPEVAHANVSFPLNLDAAGGAGPTVFVEDFEGAEPVGSFFVLDNLDFDADSESPRGDGFRCQYNDPDWESSNTFGTPEAGECEFPAYAGMSFWSTDDERAYTGSQSLHFGYDDAATPPTTPLAVLEAITLSEPVALGAGRVCEISRSIMCGDALDCPNAEACVQVTPTLSFKHQVSLMDDRALPIIGAADRAVVLLQLADDAGAPISDWIRLEAFRNGYDHRATDQGALCHFDPTDDGNTEEDFFDPADPARRLGPSSTCFPQCTFSHGGDTAASFAVDHIGSATHGPGLPGSTGVGTWISSEFDLSAFRGHQVRIRFLVSTRRGQYPSGSGLQNATWSGILAVDPGPVDDGWWIDDVRITDTLTYPVVFLGCPPLPPDLVAWWPLDGATGAAVEDLARDNDGAPVGSPTATAGRVDGALRFDGIDDYVEVPHDPSLDFGTGDFSVDAWVRADPSGNIMMIVDKRREASGPLQGWGLFTLSNRLWLQMASGGVHRNWDSGLTIADGQWHHMAVTVARGAADEGRFYVDGTALTSFSPNSVSGSLDNPIPLRLGRRSDGSPGLLDGLLDEVALHDRALDATEILPIYETGRCKD